MHYPLLDIYRYLAALIVCLSHYIFYWNKSEYFEFTSILGVELFFVLSGFVLAPQIFRLESNLKKNLKVFLIRRWIRTIPPYIIALMCAAIFFGYGDYINLIKYITYTQNVISDDAIPNFFSVAWSLSVEEWFYIFLPFSIMITSKIKYKVFKLDILTICILTILILNIIRVFYNNEQLNWGEDIRRSVIFRLDTLCFGVIAYSLKDKLRAKYLYIFFVIFSLFIIYLIFNPLLLAINILVQNIFLPFCSLCFATLLILLTRFPQPKNNTKIIGMYGANISYSMYLFHVFFIHLTQNLFQNILFSLIFYIILLKIFCLIFFIYFEKPLLKSRPNYI